MSAGRGSYGEPRFQPSALYPHSLCVRERILIRVYNQITDRHGALRVVEIAAATRAGRPNLLQEYGDLTEWAEISIYPEELVAIFGPR